MMASNHSISLHRHREYQEESGQDGIFTATTTTTNNNNNNASSIPCSRHQHAWTQSFLRDCKERGARSTALALVKACQDQSHPDDDRESSLREFAIQIIQELEVLRVASSAVAGPPLSIRSPSTINETTTILEHARSFAVPYSIHFHVESNENLFDIWQSLVGQPDPDHSLNQAGRSARCLFSHDPSHADQLLWAKQAWAHPEIDAQIQCPGKKVLLHWNKQELLWTMEGAAAAAAAAAVRPVQHNRSLSKWIQKWCEPFQIMTEEWILLLPSQEFFVASTDGSRSTKNIISTSLLRQLANERWDWLLLTLRKALTKWRLGAMFPSLMLDTAASVPESERQPPTNNSVGDSDAHGMVVVVQCLVFIARVHCAMTILQRRALESPTLLTKILRCAHLLQQHFHLRTKMIASTITTTTTTRGEVQADNDLVSDTTTSRKNKKRKTLPADPQNEGPSRGPTDRNHADTMNTTTTITSTFTKQPTPSSANDSPHAGDSSSAMNKPRQTSTDTSTTTTHDFSQQADDSSSTKQLQQPLSITNKESSSKASGSSSRDKVSWITSLPIDPFVVHLLASQHRMDVIHRSLFQILLDHPVEMLDPIDGRVFKIFATGHAAAESSKVWKVPLFGALTGRYNSAATQTECGHVYGGYFWRMCGSLAHPSKETANRTSATTTEREKEYAAPISSRTSTKQTSTATTHAANDSSANKPQADSIRENNHGTVAKKPTDSSSSFKTSWIASLSIDPFAVSLFSQHRADSIHRSLFNIIFDHPVEKLDPSTGHVLESFSTGHSAVESSSKGTQKSMFFALTGRNHCATTQTVYGHICHGFFWRLTGSLANPFQANNGSPTSAATTGKANEPSAPNSKPPTCEVAHADNDRHSQSAAGAVTKQASTIDRQVSVVPPSKISSVASIPMDPFASELLYEYADKRSASSIILSHPAEKLDCATGQVLETFSSGQEAFASFGTTEQTAFLFYALTGRYQNRTTRELCGHVYKGHFWRLKGSKAHPLENTRIPTDGTGKETGLQDEPHLASRTSWVASLPMDPFATTLLSESCLNYDEKRTQTNILLDHPVEKLDRTTGRVVETFSSGQEAFSSLENTKQCRFLLYALTGRCHNTTTKKVFGHVYKGFFWRLKGSAAHPLGKTIATGGRWRGKENQLMTRTINTNERSSTEVTQNVVANDNRQGKVAQSDRKEPRPRTATVANEQASTNDVQTRVSSSPSSKQSSWVSSLTMDPFASQLLMEYSKKKNDDMKRAPSKIIMEHPVEKLDPSTGKILQTFSDGNAAFSSFGAAKHNIFFFYALTGRNHNSTTKKFMGHVYRGHFWRLKGSQATPQVQIVSSDAVAADSNKTTISATNNKNPPLSKDDLAAGGVSIPLPEESDASQTQTQA